MSLVTAIFLHYTCMYNHIYFTYKHIDLSDSLWVFFFWRGGVRVKVLVRIEFSKTSGVYHIDVGRIYFKITQ